MIGDDAQGWTSADTINQQHRVIRDLYAEIERLKADLAEITATHARIVSGECAPDEKHCTCVPALRGEIGRLCGEIVKERLNTEVAAEMVRELKARPQPGEGK